MALLDEIEKAEPGSVEHLRLLVEAAMPAIDMLAAGIIANFGENTMTLPTINACREWVEAVKELGIQDRSKHGQDPESYKWARPTTQGGTLDG